MPTPRPSPRSTTTLRVTGRSLARAMLVVAAAVVVAVIATRATEPVMWFVEAAAVAAIATPAVHRLARHVPAWLAVIALTLGVLAVVGVLAAVAFGELSHEAERFRDSVPSAVREIQEEAPLGGLLADLKVADQVDRIADETADRFSVGRDLPGLATAIGGKVSTGFVIWVLAVMLVFAGPGMVDSAVGALPDRTAERVRPALRLAYRDVIAYLSRTAGRAVVLGVATFVAASALEVDMPVLLGLVAAVCGFIPYVGVLLGVAPLALLSVLDGTDQALAVVAVGVLWQALDSVVVQPRIHRASFTFGLFPTLVVTTIGFGLYGVTGVFLGLFLGTMLVALAIGLELEPG